MCVYVFFIFSFLSLRCGSIYHLRVNHTGCPLNPKRRRADDVDVDNGEPADKVSRHTDDSSSESESESSSEGTLLKDLLPFPFPIGTRVAVKFSETTHLGKITKMLTDPVACLVVFEDGDSAEYDEDEIRAAVALYKSHRARAGASTNSVRM